MLTTIGLILDIVVLCVIVIAGILGFRKGFLKTILGFFSWFVCILIAVFLAKYVAKLLNGIHDFAGLIGRNLAKNFAKQGDYFTKPINEFGFADKAEFILAIPEGTNKFLSQLIKVVVGSSKFDLSSTDTMANVVGNGIGSIVMVIIAGVLVFIVLRIVVALLSKIFDKISKTVVLGGLDKILGAVFAVLRVAAVIFMLSLVVVILSLLPFVNRTITPLIQENTFFVKLIYNLTNKFVSKFIIEGKMIQGWITTLWINR